MRKDLKDWPSGSNKSVGTGLSANMQNRNIKRNEEITKKYTAAPDKIVGNVHEKHHHRNTSKIIPQTRADIKINTESN